jgi:hypothetical protein
VHTWPASWLEALFVVAITLGLRPGELRALTWKHVDLVNGVIYVWKSARRGGDTKTPSSRRTLKLPRRAITALQAHKKIQAAERLAAGEDWHASNLVFCHPDGRPYTRDGLNYRFEPQTSCMPYPATLTDSVADLALVILERWAEWPTVARRCGLDCGQRSTPMRSSAFCCS